MTHCDKLILYEKAWCIVWCCLLFSNITISDLAIPDTYCSRDNTGYLCPRVLWQCGVLMSMHIVWCCYSATLQSVTWRSPIHTVLVTTRGTRARVVWSASLLISRAVNGDSVDLMSSVSKINSLFYCWLLMLNNRYFFISFSWHRLCFSQSGCRLGINFIAFI